ncbi:hypothetical protein BZL68_28280 [Escherichia coli]|nr:hypothetical protein BZL68_28280 [Escherichia coli]
MHNGIAHNGLILLWRMREGKHLCPGKTTLSDHAVLYLPVSTRGFLLSGSNRYAGLYITFIAEGSFAAKWHLNRSQFGRLLPDPDGVIG